MTSEVLKHYDCFRLGQAVTGLSTVGEFADILRMHGFATTEFVDQANLVRRGVARTHCLCVISYPFSLFLSTLRILPREFHGQTVGLMAFRRLFRTGVVTYGTFIAEKP